MIHNQKIEPIASGIATFFNYLIFTNIAYASLATFGTIFHSPTPSMALTAVPFIAVLTAVYVQYRRNKSSGTGSRNATLTPGEIIVGFKIRTEGKEWAPALKGKKLWWIILTVINFFIIGGYWQFLGNSYVYNPIEVTLRVLICILFFGSMITVGNGRITAFVGLLVVICIDYFCTPFLYSSALTVSNGYFNLKQIVQIKSSSWALLNSSALIYYLYHQNPEQFKSMLFGIFRNRK